MHVLAYLGDPSLKFSTPCILGHVLGLSCTEWQVACKHAAHMDFPSQPNQQSLRNNIPCLCSSQPCHREQMLSLQDRPWQLHLKHLHLQSKEHTDTQAQFRSALQFNYKESLESSDGTSVNQAQSNHLCNTIHRSDWLTAYISQKSL